MNRKHQLEPVLCTVHHFILQWNFMCYHSLVPVILVVYDVIVKHTGPF